MNIKINGKEQQILGFQTLKDIIISKGLDFKRVVVEYNYEIISSDNWDNIILKDNDNIEIVNFVGGG